MNFKFESFQDSSRQDGFSTVFKFVVLAFVLAHASFIVLFGLFGGSVLFFGVLLLLTLAVVAKPSNDIAVYE